MAYRHYSEDEKADALAALAANGGNVARTARELGIKQPTLRKWAKGKTKPIPLQKYTEKVSDLRGGLIDLAVALVGAAVEKAADGEGNIQQIVTSLGIVFDKLQMLDGQPTERMAVVSEPLTDDERTQRVMALLDSARTRRSGSVTERADWAD